MDNNDKNKLKDVLSTIDSVEFKWDKINMSTQPGVIAQEISTLDSGDPYDLGMFAMDPSAMVTMNTAGIAPLTTAQTVTIGPSLNYQSGFGAVPLANANFVSVGSNNSWITTQAPASLSINNVGGKNTIKTPKHEIDIDDLAETINVFKKRLLILTPDFEKHEKYPMLKEMYNEYKAMERLLSGPDKEDNNE
jgi:hypothetical protein